METNLIFITGAERSGSSLIAKIVSLAGGFGGEVSKMYEHQAITSGLKSRVYEENGYDRNAQFPLPDLGRDLGVYEPGFALYFMERMLSQGWDESKPLFYKNSRITQCWTLFAKAFPSAKFVIVRRKTPQIINSCLKTHHMNAFEKELNRKAIGAENEWDAWLWWVRYHERLFVNMIEAGVSFMEVWPDRMIEGNYSQIKEMLDWVGLPYDEEKIIKEISPLIH